MLSCFLYSHPTGDLTPCIRCWSISTLSRRLSTEHLWQSQRSSYCWLKDVLLWVRQMIISIIMFKVCRMILRISIGQRVSYHDWQSSLFEYFLKRNSYTVANIHCRRHDWVLYISLFWFKARTLWFRVCVSSWFIKLYWFKLSFAVEVLSSAHLLN